MLLLFQIRPLRQTDLVLDSLLNQNISGSFQIAFPLHFLLVLKKLSPILILSLLERSWVHLDEIRCVVHNALLRFNFRYNILTDFKLLFIFQQWVHHLTQSLLFFLHRANPKWEVWEVHIVVIVSNRYGSRSYFLDNLLLRLEEDFDPESASDRTLTSDV